MAATAIEWTDITWNPTTGCDRVSPGCAHCYALTLAKRLKAMGQPRYQRDGGRASGPGFGVTVHPDALEAPLHWKKPRRVFVNSMSDLFHEEIPDKFIDKVFAVMARTPQHTYQVLTKRPERMRAYLSSHDVGMRWAVELGMAAKDLPIETIVGWTRNGLPNVWLGVTVENQVFAHQRLPWMQRLHADGWRTMVSYEPALTAVDFEPYMDGIDWVIVGGESGPNRRPFNPNWARSVVRQCQDAGVAVFVKQMSGVRPGARLEDLPEDLRIREFPSEQGVRA